MISTEFGIFEHEIYLNIQKYHMANNRELFTFLFTYFPPKRVDSVDCNTWFLSKTQQ